MLDDDSLELAPDGFRDSCGQVCGLRACVALISLVVGCSPSPIVDPTPSIPGTAAPLVDAAMSICIEAMRRQGFADFGSNKGGLAYQVESAGVKATVCANDDGSMKIADALIVQAHGPPLELSADVASDALLPRVSRLVPIEGRRVLALGWFRSPPLGVEALLIELGGPDRPPVLEDRLLLEGSGAGFVVEEPSRRIGVVGLSPGSASLEVEAPPTRSFWHCGDQADPWQPALWFQAPGNACETRPARLTWVEIGAAGFVR